MSGIPIPRIRGNAIQRSDKTWGWEMNISIGSNSVADLEYSPTKPGFLNKELAIANMKENAIQVAEEIGSIAGTKLEGLYDLKKNEFIKK